MTDMEFDKFVPHSRTVLQFGRKVSRQRKTLPPPRRKKRRVPKTVRRRERRGIITLLRRALRQKRRVKMTRKTPSSSSFMRQPKFLPIKAGWIIKPKQTNPWQLYLLVMLIFPK